MWNDNNYYTLPNDMLQMSLQGAKAPTKAKNMVGLWGRAMQTEIMVRPHTKVYWTLNRMFALSSSLEVQALARFGIAAAHGVATT